MHADRHPIFEGLVFGLAALLALVIVFAGGRRFLGRSGGARGTASGQASSGGYGQDVPLTAAQPGARTERSVTALAPSAVSFVAGEKPAPAPIPAPPR